MAAARAVFGELGYGAATLQQIAQRADLTRPAINHYFPSKRALFQEALKQGTVLALSDGTDTGASASTLAAKLAAVVDTAVAACGQDPALPAFMVASLLDSRRYDGLVPPELESLPQLRSYLSGALTEAIARGEIVTSADVESLTELLAAMLWGMAFYAGYVGDQTQLEAAAANFELLLTNQLWQVRSDHPAEVSHADRVL